MKRIILTGLYLSLISYYVSAQEIEITNIKLKGGDVEVHYNLFDERIDRAYAINLFTSKDNFIQPVDQVGGDIGIDIEVGENKVVVWHAEQEFGSDFDGGLSLELKGNYYVPFISLDGFEKGAVLKRGKNKDFVWSGGRGDNVLNFELYRGESLVKSFDEKPNVGNATVMVPRRTKPSDDYRFRISDTRNRDEVVFTEPFTIKRKIPVGAQIGLAVGIGFGIGYLVKTLIPEKENVIEEPALPTR